MPFFFILRSNGAAVAVDCRTQRAPLRFGAVQQRLQEERQLEVPRRQPMHTKDPEEARLQAPAAKDAHAQALYACAREGHAATAGGQATGADPLEEAGWCDLSNGFFCMS